MQIHARHDATRGHGDMEPLSPGPVTHTNMATSMWTGSKTIDSRVCTIHSLPGANTSIMINKSRRGLQQYQQSTFWSCCFVRNVTAAKDIHEIRGTADIVETDTTLHVPVGRNLQNIAFNHRLKHTSIVGYFCS